MEQVVFNSHTHGKHPCGQRRESASVFNSHTRGKHRINRCPRFRSDISIPAHAGNINRHTGYRTCCNFNSCTHGKHRYFFILSSQKTFQFPHTRETLSIRRLWNTVMFQFPHKRKRPGLSPGHIYHAESGETKFSDAVYHKVQHLAFIIA